MTCEAHRLTSRPLAALLALLPALLLWAAPAPAFALEVPPFKGHVTDLAGVLSPTQAAALERKLAAYARGSGHQFALLTVPSLEGDSLEDFSIRVVKEWKLGSNTAGKDDSLLMVVDLEDHKTRIEVGYGLEGDVPDVIASRVVRNVLQPAFRAQDYFGGIDQAFDILMKAAGGESVAIDERGAGRSRPPILLVLIVLFLAYRFLGPGGMILLASGMRGGGGFRGGGGGGFGGFGGDGGGFGGGGASGDW